MIADGKTPAAIIIALGSLSTLAYILSTLPAFFFPGSDFSYFPPYLALPGKRTEVAYIYFVLYIIVGLTALLLFTLYLLAIRPAGRAGRALMAAGGRWRTDGTTRVSVGFIVFFHLIMLLIPTVLSTDIFDYIRHGRIFAVYGENPLTVPATFFSQDPFFTMGGWVGTGSVYGPLHVYISGALALISGDSVGANFFIFKAFYIAMNLVNVGLIWKITARVSPGNQLRAAVLYGFNPFILVLVAANAHNDILMVTLVLAGIYSYMKQRQLVGVLLLTLATLVKFVTLPILLVYAALIIRQESGRRRRLVMALAAAAIAGGMTVVSYLPLWEGTQTFNYLTTVGSKTNFTLPGLVRDVAAGHIRLSFSHSIVQMALGATLALYLLWHLKKVRDLDGLLTAAAGLALLTPLTLYWFQPWYLTMVLALVAIRATPVMLKTALFFSFTVLFFDSFWWNIPLSLESQKPIRALAVFGLPLALLAILKAREVLPGYAVRLMDWSQIESGRGRRAVPAVAVAEPSNRALVLSTLAITAAAAVPMAMVIASSPQLRSVAELVAIKLRLLTSLF